MNVPPGGSAEHRQIGVGRKPPRSEGEGAGGRGRNATLASTPPPASDPCPQARFGEGRGRYLPSAGGFSEAGAQLAVAKAALSPRLRRFAAWYYRSGMDIPLPLATTRPTSAWIAGSAGTSPGCRRAPSRSCAAPARSASTAIAPRPPRAWRPARACASRRCPRRPPPKPAPAVEPGMAQDLQRLVIYRDDHVIALNKPHGLPVQGGPGITHHLDALARRVALRLAGPAAPGAPAGSRHLRRAAAGAHARRRGEAGRLVPRPRGGEDLLGGHRAPADPVRRAASTCR